MFLNIFFKNIKFLFSLLTKVLFKYIIRVMENKEMEIEILNNQFNIDFEGLDQKEESISLSTETLIKSQNYDYIKDEVLFVVVRAQNKDIAPDLPSLKLCGKKMIDWVLLAGATCQQVVIDDKEDIISSVRNLNTTKKYIAVFYSDLPLFDKSSFYKIMDYFTSRSINFLQLTRGFVVKSEFLKNSPNFMQSADGGIEIVPLFRCDTSAKLVKAYEILNERILNYHINSGVTIFGKNTVFIDADVEIDGGVVIYPNNIISGESVIAAGSILESGNTIENSIILKNCKLKSSYIQNSKITEGQTLEGEKIIKEVR